MSVVKLVLDKRRMKKTCKFPLVFRVFYKVKYFDISTKVDLLEGEFNNELQVIVSNKVLNKEIQSKLKQLDKAVRKYFAENPDATLESVKSAFKSPVKSKVKEDVALTISKFWKAEIDRLILIGRSGGASVFECSYKVVSKLIDLDRPFKEITHKDLIDVENQLRARGVSYNSISVYLRSFRTLCNRAILLDYVDQSWYPFFKYKVKKEITSPRVLSLEQIKKLFALDLEVTHIHYRSLQICKLMFLMRGINFRDLSVCIKKDIVTGSLIYKRSKTKTIYNIKIEPEMKVLIDILSNNETLIGVYSEEQVLRLNFDRGMMKEYKQKLSLFNDHLKAIGKGLGFEISITSYVLRYSFANIAREIGFSVNEIGYLLGHKSSSHSLTENYLLSYNQSKMDEMAKKVISIL
jgi:integrase/recombinase XerD